MGVSFMTGRYNDRRSPVPFHLRDRVEWVKCCMSRGLTIRSADEGIVYLSSKQSAKIQDNLPGQECRGMNGFQK